MKTIRTNIDKLSRSAKLWFNALSDQSIESWTDLYESFAAYFTTTERQWVTLAAISGIKQVNKYNMRSYIYCFTQEFVEVEGAEKGLKCRIFENGLLWDSSFKQKVGKKGSSYHEGTFELSSIFHPP